ncbi:hypothetical protein PORY_002055 [Pneumocystis oryctolagi]|uniref:Uncharacterized protein n=1 Tax=Pneumocystis oryctolagi TaxID=42067 RepID=A0ACB7CDU9_9ASCO|nr:hypothetical protein PORY_002055 [Pneumocystis oryctolagi]
MIVPNKLQIALAIVICQSKLPCLTIEEYIDYIRISLRKNKKKDEKDTCGCFDIICFWRNLFENVDRENVKLRIKVMELEKGLVLYKIEVEPLCLYIVLESQKSSLQVNNLCKNKIFQLETSDKHIFDMEKIDVLLHDSVSEKLYDSFHLFYLSCLLPTSVTNTSEFRDMSVFEALQRLCNSLSRYITDSISMALNYKRIKAFRAILEYITYVAKFSWNDESYYIDSLSSVFDSFFELIRYQSSYHMSSVRNSFESSLEIFGKNNSYVDERYEIVCLVLNITNQFYMLFPIVVDLLVKHIKISYTRCSDCNVLLATRNSENSACGYYLYSLSVLCRKNRRIPSDNLEQLVKLVERNSRDFRCFELDKVLWNTISHPDDEVMFFGPSIFQIKKDNEIYLLCLSNGNAEGLAKIRKEELMKSCNILGIFHKNIKIIENSSLQDSMTSYWDPNIISQLVSEFVIEKNIDIIITFDHLGISKHPNHIACYHGVFAFLNSLETRKPSVYVLITVSILRKYVLFFDLFITMALYIYYRCLYIGFSKLFRNKNKNHVLYFFMNSPFQVLKLQKAMIKGHTSQMKWFRWLYIFTSRYMLFNELEKKK